MQTEEWCGFTVACDDKDHNAYVILKGILERGLTGIQRKLKTVDVSSFPLYHYIYLDTSDKLFSVYMQSDCGIYIGIYDRGKNQIERHCNYSDLETITMEDLDSLFLRLENVINRGYDVVKNERLKNAWNTCIAQELTFAHEKELEYDILL